MIKRITSSKGIVTAVWVLGLIVISGLVLCYKKSQFTK